MWTVTAPRAETSEASAQKQVEKTHNFRILFTLEFNIFCSINCFAFADFTFGKYIFGVSTRRNKRFNKINRYYKMLEQKTFFLPTKKQ